MSNFNPTGRHESLRRHHDFLNRVAKSLPVGARSEFREIEMTSLALAMDACGLTDYPAVVGEGAGERVSGACVCERCGQDFYHHPMDWRLIGYGNVPFLNIVCDGRRVKL